MSILSIIGVPNKKLRCPVPSGCNIICKYFTWTDGCPNEKEFITGRYKETQEFYGTAFNLMTFSEFNNLLHS